MVGSHNMLCNDIIPNGKSRDTDCLRISLYSTFNTIDENHVFVATTTPPPPNHPTLP